MIFSWDYVVAVFIYLVTHGVDPLAAGHWLAQVFLGAP